MRKFARGAVAFSLTVLLDSDAWPVVLTTERLRLRPLEVGDRPWLLELQTDGEVRHFLGGARNFGAAELAVEAMLLAEWHWLATEAGTGTSAGLLSFDKRRGELEVSYVFHPPAWGRGLAKEAMGVLLPWAANALGVTTVIAVTQVANLRSLRLLEGCGFVEESRFVEYGEPQVQLRKSIAADH